MRFYQIKTLHAVMLVEKTIAQYEAMQEIVKTLVNQGNYCLAKKVKQKATFIINRANNMLEAYIFKHSYNLEYNDEVQLKKLSGVIYTMIFND